MAVEYVYLISNGSTDIYTNTLTDFKNDVFFSKNKLIDEIAVSEIWVEDRFTSPYVPDENKCPTIICSKTKPEETND